MANQKDNNIFWDIYTPLSYNALFNFVVGERGNGKTYGCKKYVIEKFLDTGEQFGYVRRYKEEYKQSANTFFNDLIANNEFPDTQFEVKGSKFLINGLEAGYGFILSTQSKKKSMSFPNIKTLVFDEFLLDPKNVMDRFLSNEVEAFLNMYETVARMRDVRVFFIANAFTWQNPYFLYFGIEFPKSKKRIKVKNDILIQITESLAYRMEKNKTRFANLMKDTDFKKHAIDNEFIRDTEDFIIEQPKKQVYMFTIVSNKEKFGVWREPSTSRLFISKKYNPTSKIIYTTMENHEPNMLLLKGAYRSPLIKLLIISFRMGGVFYDSVRTKNMIIKTLRSVI